MKLFVVVEGESEMRFVRQTLKPHLRLDPIAVKVRTGTTPQGRPAYGGGDWTKWLADIRNCLRPSGPRRVTTMFDLYGLPQNFPRLQSLAGADTSKVVSELEEAMRQQVADDRFVPFLLRHEFETLVLASLRTSAICCMPPSMRPWMRSPARSGMPRKKSTVARTLRRPSASPPPASTTAS